MNRKRKPVTIKQLAKFCQMAAKLVDKKKDVGEKEIQQALNDILSSQNMDFVREVNLLADLQGQIVDPTRKDGNIDFVFAGTLGVEIKILNSPKKKRNRSESQSIYDLGQITMDAVRLKNAKTLTDYALVLFIKGHHVADYDTPAEFRRYLHNRLFVDFVNCSKIGREFNPTTKFANQKFASAYQAQKKIAIKLGFDDTYSSSSPLRKSYVTFSDKYAVVCLQVY